MKAKILAIVLTLMLVISCFPLMSFALDENETILIQQVYGGNQKGSTPFDRSFIELYNTGDDEVNLDGYSIGYQSARSSAKQAGGTDGTEVTLALDGYSIPAHTSFLVACAAESTTADFLVCPIDSYDVSWDQALDNKQYHIALYNGETVVDSVTAKDIDLTEEVAGEGNAVLDISKQKSIRRINFQDTDDNAADFQIVKYEKVSLNYLYNVAEYVAAYAPRSTEDGAWDETPTMAENFVGYDFVKQGGYQGPYSSDDTVAFGDDGLEFDSSVVDGYMTAELLPQDADTFKYAIVTIKTSEGMTASNFALTIGNVAQPWNAWTVADTLAAPADVTDEFATVILDLETSGVTNVVVADAPDLALNKNGDTDDEGIITISSIRFTNKASLETPLKNFLGYNFVSNIGYWGPWSEDGMASLSNTSEGLLFDTSVTNSYVTAELNPQEAKFRQYAKVTIKAYDASLMQGEFSLSIGGVGKRWQDWTFVGDDNTITDEFKTFTIDLEASGVTSLVDKNSDLALNKSTAVDSEGTIAVQYIEFTNGSYELDVDTDEPEDPEDPEEPEAIVGYDFVKETGYWGPYTEEGMAELTEDGLAFDTSVTNSYVTAELNPQETPFYRYAYVTVKASDADLVSGEFSLTIGGVGKRWQDWEFVGDNTITDESQTFIIDLEASGVTDLVVDGLDFAINRSTAVDDEGILTFASVEFKDELPEDTDEPIIGYDFVNQTGYWGPYFDAGMVELTEDGLAFDTSVTNSYVTAEINPQEIPFYRYAYITIKASDASLYQGGFSLTLGNAGGKGWGAWTFVGEDTTLTEEFKTFVIDLEESGATSLVNPSTAPDFALNRSTDIEDEGIITVKSVAFSNVAPEEPEVPDGPCSLMVSSVAPTTTAAIQDGDEVNFVANIRNIGEYASGNYTVSFYLNGRLLEEVEVDEAIEAGSSARITTTVGKNVSFGSSTVKVFVDCEKDDDDTDNIAKARFIVD